MDEQNPQTPETAADEPSRRRWIHNWPVLIPLLLVGGVLWISLWYSRRAQLLEDASFVEFDAPTWSSLEQFAGAEVRSLVGSPTALHLTDGQMTSTNLRIVAGFDELTDFSAAGMNDADLESLAGCPKLQSLHLERTSITDAGVQSLVDFAELENLWLTTDQPLSDVSLQAVSALKNLQNLTLDTPQLAPLDLRPLKELSDLEYLTLTSAKVHGDQLKHLIPLTKLRALQLERCQIDIDALAALQPIPSAPMLLFNGSNVSDAHMPAIRELPWLLYLYLPGTQVSDEACQRLKRERPGMYIVDVSGRHVVLADVESDE